MGTAGAVAVEGEGVGGDGAAPDAAEVVCFQEEAGFRIATAASAMAIAMSGHFRTQSARADTRTLPLACHSEVSKYWKVLFFTPGPLRAV